ncbi:MAG TPA: serine/threonine-protein kinase, partial [Thermoanaerobaculia bacterium]|nr:serine/threonine-protein kinase [Thermoanaerobaculia bacterium]
MTTTIVLPMTTVPSESGLLRLAIAKGLLRWEDLDAVSERLPEENDSADPTRGRWIRALVAAGLLTPAAVSDLLDELREDLTPDFTGRARAAPPSRPVTPFPLPSPDLAPEFRFLEGWERYRVERLLGSGGMGTVFKAFDPTLGRRIALKFLHRNDATQTERFLREARAQARVVHPTICQVHEVGEVGGRPYIAMQYIEGQGLGELRSELSLNEKVALVRDVARAVHAAHRTGLVHRDLKPGNILLTREESGELHPYVVDFGLALEQDETGLSVSGTISGTPAYISPEQAQGRPLDRRTDVYSLGVVLYELLAGAPPFTGGNLARILVRVVQEDPKPLRQIDPAVPQDLETVIAKCLEKDPERRYASGRDLAEDLDRFLDGEPVQARPASWFYRAGKRLRKNRPLAIVSAAAAVALLVMGMLSLRAQWQARERAELAQRFGQRIGELEASLLYEAFLPLHDITPSKRRLRRELEAIRAEMKRIGPIAEGPGNYAIGQGHLALRQYESARTHLERAWKAGERSPELAAALGRTLG